MTSLAAAIEVIPTVVTIIDANYTFQFILYNTNSGLWYILHARVHADELVSKPDKLEHASQVIKHAKSNSVHIMKISIYSRVSICKHQVRTKLYIPYVASYLANYNNNQSTTRWKNDSCYMWCILHNVLFVCVYIYMCMCVATLWIIVASCC